MILTCKPGVENPGQAVKDRSQGEEVLLEKCGVGEGGDGTCQPQLKGFITPIVHPCF